MVTVLRSTVEAGVTVVTVGNGAEETGTVTVSRSATVDGGSSSTVGTDRRTGADQVTAVDVVATVKTGVVSVVPPNPGTPQG